MDRKAKEWRCCSGRWSYCSLLSSRKFCSVTSWQLQLLENSLILFIIIFLNSAFAELGTTMSSILVKLTFLQSKNLSFSVTFAYFITLLPKSNARVSESKPIIASSVISVSYRKNGVFSPKMRIMHLFLTSLEPWLELTVKGVSTGFTIFCSFTGLTYFFGVPLSIRLFRVLSANYRSTNGSRERFLKMNEVIMFGSVIVFSRDAVPKMLYTAVIVRGALGSS